MAAPVRRRPEHPFAAADCRSIAVYEYTPHKKDVMRRRLPTANKPMPSPDALVIAIAIPPSKANAPIIAKVGLLT